jgi:prepilin-type N-terminal cleavage/methylation domain-containing protein
MVQFAGLGGASVPAPSRAVALRRAGASRLVSNHAAPNNVLPTSCRQKALFRRRPHLLHCQAAGALICLLAVNPVSLGRLYGAGSVQGRPFSSSGFSLIELMIVIAIILFLFTLYFKSSSGPSGNGLAECQRNLESIYTALRVYAADYHDTFPVVASAKTSEIPLSRLVPRYTSVTEIFICPSGFDKKLPEARPFESRRISYAYCMGRKLNDGADQLLMSDAQVNALPKAAGQPVFSLDGKRPGNNHRELGGNLLFCDGQVKPGPARAEAPILFPASAILLNPKPRL